MVLPLHGLDGHLLLRLRVERQVHEAVRAVADQAQDLVALQAWGEERGAIIGETMCLEVSSFA